MLMVSLQVERLQTYYPLTKEKSHMKLEKTLMLDSGRLVKISKVSTSVTPAAGVEFDVQIKDPREEHFHPPIGVSHPKYWKLKKMGPSESRSLQLAYSGLSAKQLRKVAHELEQEFLANRMLVNSASH